MTQLQEVPAARNAPRRVPVEHRAGPSGLRPVPRLTGLGNRAGGSASAACSAHVLLTPIAEAPVSLSADEATLRERILATGAPQATAVASLLERTLADAASADLREHICARFAVALSEHHRERDLLAALGLHALHAALSRIRWSVLSGAMPTLTALAAVARLVRNGEWRDMAPVLSALAAGLPPLREYAQFEQLVRALPAALRDTLAALQEWVVQADDAMRPRVHVDPVTALAVAAVLWRLQRTLPRGAVPDRALDRFIATLPEHWGRLAGTFRIGGALLAPPAPTQVARQLTHVPSATPRSSAAPPDPRSAAAAATAATSGAARTRDHGLIGWGAGLASSGLLMVYHGWQMLSGNRSAHVVPDDVHLGGAVTPAAPDVAESSLESAITLLDEVVDIEGGGSVWQDLYDRLHHTAVEAGRAGELVQARLLANDMGEVVAAHLGLLPASSAPRRARREAASLQVAGEQLAQAVLELPSRPTHPEDVVTGNDERVPVALERLHLRNWVNRNDTTVAAQDVRLVVAMRTLEFAEKRLEQVGRWLPSLDRHVGALLTRQIFEATQVTLDPDGIRRNIFTDYPTWPEWERKQKQPPDPQQVGRYRDFPRDRRIRSGLVSSHTLVEAVFLPRETDDARTGLYPSGEPGTHWPEDEITRPSLAEFNAVITGHDYIGSFRDSLDAFIASVRSNAARPEREAYVEAISQRLSGSGTLLAAAGTLSAPGKWLLDTLLRYPARFGGSGSEMGRALALPGQDIRVHALVARPPGGDDVPLHGLLLAQSLPSPQRSEGALLVIAPSRQPIVQEFPSLEEALQQLRHDLSDQLHRWVPAHQHARWRTGDGPVLRGEAVDGHLLRALFIQELTLRSQQLHYGNMTSTAEARKDYLALDQRLRRLPMPVSMPLLEAALERMTEGIHDPYALAGAHWLVQARTSAQSLLRNVGVEDARWLASLSTLRSVLEASYPPPYRYVADRLKAAVLKRHGVVISAEDFQLVRFSGGTPSRESPSGFVHDLSQKVSALGLVEAAFIKATGFPDGSPGSYELGIYAKDNSTTYDQATEAGNLLPDQFIDLVRNMDLRSDYLAVLNAFWKEHREDVGVYLRGVYMFSAWQQFAEGSLSARGLKLAFAATGYMVLSQAEKRAFRCRAADGARISWISLYGRQATLMRIENPSWPEVLLYAPGDAIAFREFSDTQQMQAWLTRVANSEQGRGWLHAAFDLADLQDGWFSNGVDTALDKAHGDIFLGNQSALEIDGSDLFEALIDRLHQHTVNDAGVLFSSNWEAWREYLLVRVAKFNLLTGLGSIAMPWLLPIAAAGSGLEFALGLEKAIDGRTQEDRSAGAVSAGWGLFGLALSAPFAIARTAGMATRDGAQVVPEIQEMAEVGVADPLRGFSARYAQPADMIVDGARSADNGVYHYLGHHYIRQSGHVYEVGFDEANQTWRLRNPNPGGLYHAPVRLNADGLWEPHSEVGLRGGQGPFPDALSSSSSLSRVGSGSSSSGGTPSVSRSTSIASSYRGAMETQSRLLTSSRSLDLSSRDFRWGMEHPERVEMPVGVTASRSVHELKELFVSGGLEAVQRGALSVVIARMEGVQRLEYILRMEAVIRDAVDEGGGQYFAVSQSLLNVRSGGSMGWCTGLSRMMAMALGQGKAMELVRNLRLALRRPDEGIGAEFLSYVRDAQGVALLPGATSAQTRIAFDEFAQFLKGVQGNAQFLLTGTVHSMVLAVEEQATGARFYTHYCPTLGMTRFSSASRFNAWMHRLFTSRYFSSLQWAADGRWAETLAEMYGATRATENAPPTLFMIRQVAPEKLLEQARQRGWDRLLEFVPE